MAKFQFMEQSISQNQLHRSINLWRPSSSIGWLMSLSESEWPEYGGAVLTPLIARQSV